MGKVRTTKRRYLMKNLIRTSALCLATLVSSHLAFAESNGVEPVEAKLMAQSGERTATQSADATQTRSKTATQLRDGSGSGDAKMTQAKTGDAKMTQAKTGNAKMTQAKIGDAKMTQAKTGDAKMTQAKTGNAKMTQAKTGDAKMTQAKTGTRAGQGGTLRQALRTRDQLRIHAETKSGAGTGTPTMARENMGGTGEKCNADAAEHRQERRGSGSGTTSAGTASGTKAGAGNMKGGAN